MDIEDYVDKYRGSKKKVRFALVALIALLPALDEWFSIGETLDNQRTQLEAELVALTSAFNAAKQKTAELPALLTKLGEIELELKKAREVLPEKIELDNILSSLGGLEKDCGIRLVKFTPGKEVQPNPLLEYKEVTIDLEMQGDFGSTMHFLDRLVHMPNLTNIRGVQFLSEKDKGTTDNPILKSKAQLIVFVGM